MNALIVGSDKTPLLRYLPRRDFLLIDDGFFIDQVRARARAFDVTKHTFNPLKDITYRTARDLASVLYDADPGGDSTLTVRNGKRALTRLALSGVTQLGHMTGDRKDPAIAEALATVENILLSPVLKSVLEGRKNVFSITGTIVARLDRAALGEFDCFVLANLLISQYPGTVVIPDFGFYATPFHTSLIRQNRLIAGVTSFDEITDARLRNRLVQIEEKVPSRCTPDDAAILAVYAGYVRGTEGHTTFVQQAIA